MRGNAKITIATIKVGATPGPQSWEQRQRAWLNKIAPSTIGNDAPIDVLLKLASAPKKGK